MRAVIGVTDNAWATFLRERPAITEANFWLPSPKQGFKALQTGEPFLFKTHFPENRLVGGGFFSGFARLTIGEAWALFGEGNGAATLDELAAAIARYRKAAPDPRMLIGCVLLRDLFFVPSGAQVPAPDDFAKNIVRFKGYDLQTTGNDIGHRLDVMLERADMRISDDYDPAPGSVPGPVFGLPRLVAPRVGQQAFKGLVLTSYERRCAVTGNRIEPVLEAAHIRPIASQGENRLDNGLLLRSDVHTLFDKGYLGVDERFRLHVSDRLRKDWGNGREFYDRAGQVINIPSRVADRPARDFVTWHMDTVFQA